VRSSSPSYLRELQAARDAAEAAYARLGDFDRSACTKDARRLLTNSKRRLRLGIEAPLFSLGAHPVTVLYEAIRAVLGNLDQLERGATAEQRPIVAEARADLHRAEDDLRGPYWRGDLN